MMDRIGCNEISERVNFFTEVAYLFTALILPIIMIIFPANVFVNWQMLLEDQLYRNSLSSSVLKHTIVYGTHTHTHKHTHTHTHNHSLTHTHITFTYTYTLRYVLPDEKVDRFMESRYSIKTR